MNENLTPLNDNFIQVFPDIVQMYPSTDVEVKHRANPNEHGCLLTVWWKI